MKVIIRSHSDPASPYELGVFSLDPQGKVTCDNAGLLAELTACGVLTGAGHFFPSDGAEFLRHLPKHFLGSFVRAELVDDPPVMFAAPVISGVELRPECLRLVLEREGREEVATLSGRPPIEEWSRGEGCTGCAADVRVRELWARWALWSCAGLPESVADAPQVLSAEDAAEALANHVEALEEIFNAGDGHEE